MSTYPGVIDSFPTHVDNTEFMVAAYLNNVQLAILALENTLGVNPQGTYGSVQAWLASLQASISSGVTLDTAAGDIVAVGTSAAAGSVGKAADAGHRHVGVASISINGGGAASGAVSFNAVTSLNVNGGGAQSGALSLSVVTSLNVNGGGAQTGALSITTISIDSTASDIQGDGIAGAAGSKGQAADAQHQHPASLLMLMSI